MTGAEHIRRRAVLKGLAMLGLSPLPAAVCANSAHTEPAPNPPLSQAALVRQPTSLALGLGLGLTWSRGQGKEQTL